METKPYLLVEGVNLNHGIFDTSQLSVVRGGSFLFREAINDVAAEFLSQMQPLSTGASSGLFLLTDGLDMSVLAGKVETYLRGHEQYQYLTFIVVTERGESLRVVKECLRSRLRFAQLRSVSDAPDRIKSGVPCELEGFRTARVDSEPVMVQGQSRRVSDSVAVRLQHGRSRRWSHYLKTLQASNVFLAEDALLDYGFTQDFHTLAENPDAFLNGKIAVLYLDGNAFGKHEHAVLEEAQTQGHDQAQALSAFDQDMKKRRATFLASLLTEMLKTKGESVFLDPLSHVNGQSALRLETLLWGGDELLFVVPAWMGFDLLQFFFAQSADWQQNDKPLTHAGGLVFCKAKTPIAITKDLAKELAERVKDAPGGRDENRFDYAVLESVDIPDAHAVEAFFNLHYPACAASRPDGMRAALQWFSDRGKVATLLDGQHLSRSAIYRLGDLIANTEMAQGGSQTWDDLWQSNPPSDINQQTLLERRLIALSNHPLELRSGLEAVFLLFALDADDPQQRGWMWLHLLELWDYLIPGKQAGGQ